MFREVERGQRVFCALMAWSINALSNVEVNGVLAQDRVLSVSGNAYSELGTTPLLGRLLTPEDSNLSAGSNTQVAVLGYEFWERRLVGPPDIVGKQISIEGHPFTIIGVTRKWFTGLTTGEPPEITVPLPAIPLIMSGGFDVESRSILRLYPMRHYRASSRPAAIFLARCTSRFRFDASARPTPANLPFHES